MISLEENLSQLHTRLTAFATEVKVRRKEKRLIGGLLKVVVMTVPATERLLEWMAVEVDWRVQFQRSIMPQPKAVDDQTRVDANVEELSVRLLTHERAK